MITNIGKARPASPGSERGWQGLRLTRQRRVVLDAVRESNGHPDADEIYQRARRTLPKISLGTVYRTLGVLRDTGLIRELHFGRAQGRYELERGPHHHVVCSECGLIQDVPAAAFSDLAERARAATRFEVREHRLEFVGVCPACRAGKQQTVPPSRAGRRVGPSVARKTKQEVRERHVKES
jgi:Fur family peroxide stress response transcriptional regulator